MPEQLQATRNSDGMRELGRRNLARDMECLDDGLHFVWFDDAAEREFSRVFRLFDIVANDPCRHRQLFDEGSGFHAGLLRRQERTIDPTVSPGGERIVGCRYWPDHRIASMTELRLEHESDDGFRFEDEYNLAHAVLIHLVQRKFRSRHANIDLRQAGKKSSFFANEAAQRQRRTVRQVPDGSSQQGKQCAPCHCAG